MTITTPGGVTNQRLLHGLEQALLGSGLRLSRRENDWVFRFEPNLVINVATLWRLRNSSGIVFTNEDDLQQFGLPKPVDAEAQANQLLRDTVVSTVRINQSCADVAITFTNGFELDVVTTSSGYESWRAYIGEDLIVGRGEGLVTYSAPA